MTSSTRPASSTLLSTPSSIPSSIPSSAPSAATALRAAADRVRTDAAQREALWSNGFTRRRLLGGGLGLGVAALGSQLVTARVAFGAPSATTGTLVVVFLRGGMDGLSLLVPAGDTDYLTARGSLAVPATTLIPLGRGFGLHPAMAPLQPLVRQGKLVAVPAVSTPDLSRSHFQAQDCLERGGSQTGPQTGWLDRVLEQSGPGTTFRSVALGGLMPRSMAGLEPSISMTSLAGLSIPGAETEPARSATLEALTALYTGVDGLLGEQGPLAVDAVRTAAAITSVPTTVVYPDNPFAASLKDVAALVKAGTGVRVAALDLGGWDMHTGLGTVDSGDMQALVGELAASLAAFADDLGGHLARTTVVTMSEFGRRLEANASGGTDHGHGGVSLVLGGGVTQGVKGRWVGLGADVLDDGDVPGTNDYRDVLSEVVGARLGLTHGQLGVVFPGWKPTRLGIMA